MPYTGMLDIGMGVFESWRIPPKAPKYTKRNTKKSKMAKSSRRNNRKH